MRILGRLSLGGATKQVCFLHNALRDRFDTVLVTGSMDEGEGDMTSLLNTYEGIYFIDSMRRSVGFWQELKTLVQIVRVLRRERADIVHTHCSKAGTLGRVAAALTKVPVRVHTYHGHIFNGHFGPIKSRMYVWVERVLNRISTAAIAISDQQVDDLTGVYAVVPREKTVVIHDGIDLERFSECKSGDAVRNEFGISADKVLVVWAGRFAYIKNIELLGEVICCSANRCPKVHFLLVGSGPDCAKAKHLTRDCANVTFAGMRHDMEAIWSAADLALLTSRSEGTPATLIEAMAAGRPFISTNVGGVIDLTVPPRTLDPATSALWTANAVLTPPDAQTIVSCIEHLAGDPDKRQRMGSAGTEFVSAQHSFARMLSELEVTYRRLHARSSGQGMQTVEYVGRFS